MSRKSPIPKMLWAAEHLWQIKGISLSVISIAMAVMGMSEGLIILASLGASPWTVFAQGVAIQTGLSVGTVIALISVVVLTLWLPLKLRPGLGTLLNVIIIALFVDITLYFIDPPSTMVTRTLFMSMGIFFFGIGTAFYLSCQLGAGPRDGLMVGLCQKYGWKIGTVRTSIEAFVSLLGFLLGGTVGISTLVFAFGVGWIIQGTVVLFQRYKRSDFL